VYWVFECWKDMGHDALDEMDALTRDEEGEAGGGGIYP